MQAIGSDTELVVFAAGLMFLFALSLGIVKYRQMATSESALAHPYTDTAHRAALLYSFALLLAAVLVELGSFSETVNLVAAGVLTFFFLAAVVGYAIHGLRRDTDNQFRDPVAGTHAFMFALVIGEIAAWLVLLAGFADARLL